MRREKARTEAARSLQKAEELQRKQDAAKGLRDVEEQHLRKKIEALEGGTVPDLEKERSRLEKKLEKATDLARAFQKELASEQQVTKGLLENMSKLREENDKRKKETGDLQDQVKDLSEQLQDVLFTLTAQARIAEEGGEGGDVIVQQQQQQQQQQQRSRRTGNGRKR